MKLFGRTSSINVRKVLWTAREIGLQFEHDAEWATASKPTSDRRFLLLNPFGLVPVWSDDHGTLWESNAICRYLARRQGRTDLLPLEPHAAAKVERWMDWSASDLNRSWSYAFMALVRGHPDYRDPGEIARSSDAWNRQVLVADGELAKSGGFLEGSVFTLADIAVGLALHRWRTTPIEHCDAPSVRDYLRRLEERPLFRELASADLP